MKPITKSWSINIELTNHCHLNCLYCTRYVRHLKPEQKFTMTIEQFDFILRMLRGWPTRINFFGGEPTIHPEFKEFCRLARKHYPRRKLQLFTAGGKAYQENIDLINKTFKYIYHNEHLENKELCRHQPHTLSIREVVPDERVRNYLIENCWVERTWCPSIYPWGAYFCEMAGSLDLILFDRANAVPLFKGWHKKADFLHQRKLCQYCGMAIPIERELISNKQEKFTPGLLKMLQGRLMLRTDERWIKVFDKQLTLEEIRENAKSWYPGNFRGDKFDDEISNEGLGIKKFKL